MSVLHAVLKKICKGLTNFLRDRSKNYLRIKKNIKSFELDLEGRDNLHKALECQEDGKKLEARQDPSLKRGYFIFSD